MKEGGAIKQPPSKVELQNISTRQRMQRRL